MRYYSPGQAAEQSGFSLDTLRYYERIGLMHDVGRTASGRRRYSEIDLRWLEMLRCLRETGMPIAEMVRFAELTRGGKETIPERLALLEAHDARVGDRIARLREQREQINWKIGLYRSHAATAPARLLRDVPQAPRERSRP